MAADAYVQQAASQVRAAVAALTDDIRAIQQEAYRAESGLHAEQNSNENEEATLRVELAATQDSRHRHEIEAEIAAHDRTAHQKRHDAEQRSVDAARVVQGKHDVISSLQGIVSQLDSLVGRVR